jgi:hypothetical protein
MTIAIVLFVFIDFSFIVDVCQFVKSYSLPAGASAWLGVMRLTETNGAPSTLSAKF